MIETKVITNAPRTTAKIIVDENGYLQTGQEVSVKGIENVNIAHNSIHIWLQNGKHFWCYIKEG